MAYVDSLLATGERVVRVATHDDKRPLRHLDAAALRQAYPDARIDWVVSVPLASLVILIIAALIVRWGKRAVTAVITRITTPRPARP